MVLVDDMMPQQSVDKRNSDKVEKWGLASSKCVVCCDFVTAGSRRSVYLKEEFEFHNNQNSGNKNGRQTLRGRFGIK